MRTVLSPANPLARFVAALALAGSLLAMTPTSVTAAAPVGYTATLSSALAAPKQAIIDEALWKCSADTCAANGNFGRPVMVCQQVVRKFGAVAAFTSSAGVLSAEDLAKCNKR